LLATITATSLWKIGVAVDLEDEEIELDHTESGIGDVDEMIEQGFDSGGHMRGIGRRCSNFCKATTKLGSLRENGHEKAR